MSPQIVTVAKPGQLALADLDVIDFSLPACCVVPEQKAHSVSTKGICLIAAIGLAARSVFAPLFPPDAASFDYYLEEAYHQFICGAGERKAVDPVVFAQVKDAFLVPIAIEKQKEDEKNRRPYVKDSPVPPPVSPPCPCGQTQTTSLLVRRRTGWFRLDNTGPAS